MAFNLATALAQLDGRQSEGTIDKLLGKVKELAVPPFAGQIDAIGKHFANIMNPVNKVSTALSGLGAGVGISSRVRMAARPHVSRPGMAGDIRAKSGNSMTGRLRSGLSASGRARPGLPAGGAAAEQPFQFASLAGLAEKMQQEAAQQDSDRQHLQAQQEANQHLGNLAGAAAGAGLRVQVVGAQPGSW
jgi:hypothetical protein